MKKLIYILPAALLLAACSSSQSSASSNTSADKTQSSTSQSSSSSSSASSSTSTDEETKDDDLDLGGTSVTTSKVDLSSYSGNVIIDKAGTYTISGNLNGTLIVYAPKQEVTLNFDDATITSTDGPALYVRKASQVNINVNGSASLSATGNTSYDTLNAGIYSKADLSFAGEGELDVNCTFGHGIKAKDTLSMESLTANITALDDGIHINETAEINANLNITTSSDEGIQSEESMIISGGNINITSVGDCIRAETDLQITGGTLNLSTSQNEGIESKDSLTISGGDIYINSYDDGINAANSLTISGGSVYIQASRNDGIDSNGTLTFSGGTITVVAAMAPDGAFDVDNTPFVISGGDIVGVGPNATLPTETKQNVLVIGGSGTVTSVEVKDSSGNTLILREGLSGSGSSSQTITISSPSLTTGSTVEVYVNGNSIGSTTISSGTTTLGSVSTMGGGGAGLNQGGMGGRR